VLTGAIVKEGVKNVQAGVDPMEIKRGIDLAVQKVLETLKAESIEVKDRE